jgi:hypothetical protein
MPGKYRIIKTVNTRNTHTLKRVRRMVCTIFKTMVLKLSAKILKVKRRCKNKKASGSRLAFRNEYE